MRDGEERPADPARGAPATPASEPSAVPAATLPFPLRPVPGETASRAASPADLAPLVLACTFVLAFCSIVYELLLGQALSAFLGNTVLRFAVTIGLYLFSMGMGALLAGRRLLADPVLSLQKVELLLTLLGGSSVVLLFAADGVGIGAGAVSVLAHVLVAAVGVLSGVEIPLLIETRSRGAHGRASGDDPGAPGEVLGIDYAGAFVGTVAFALFFYPRAGLLRTAFSVAALNAVVGVALGVLRLRSLPRDGTPRRTGRRLVAIQAALLAALLVAWTCSSAISEAGLARYLRG